MVAIESMLQHTATIKRGVHTKTSKAKDLGETTVSTLTPCLIVAVNSATETIALGLGDVKNYVGYFAGGADIEPGDEVTRSDARAASDDIFTVVSKTALFRQTDDNGHIEVALVKKEVG